MKRAIAIFVMLGVCACGGGAGDDDGELPVMAQVLGGFDAYDAIAVQNGVVSVEIPGTGVVSCPIAGCTAPSVVASSISYVSGALGSPLLYAAQVGTLDGVSGELHAVDSSGDRAIATGLSYPSWVATAGALTFVAEDSYSYDETPATIDCIGCTSDGKVTPWISGIAGGTYGLFADASNVYVLADDPTFTSVQLLACSSSHPCFAEPRVVLTGLDQTISAQQIASDGASVYVARATTSDVVRVDASGTVTTILDKTSATALTWDAATSALWFGTLTGSVGHVGADGSNRVMLASGSGSIRAIATDAANVYVVTGASGEIVMKTTK